MADPVEDVAAVPVSEATQNAVNDVDEHTPDTPTPPPPVEASALEALTETVADVAASVVTLTETVSHLGHDDASPVKLPWTARGGKHEHKDEE